MKRTILSLLLVGLTLQSPPTAGADAAGVQRGKYLVDAMGCNDCHTPWKMGERGPEPDMSLYLSGHPATMALPPAPALPPGPWIAVAAATFTAWSGPWGVSFTANLTGDKETGMGGWTLDEFVGAMRTGRHRGMGRPILPPMPFPNIGGLTDEDLNDMFSYLLSVPPIHNKVPDPIPPAMPGH